MTELNQPTWQPYREPLRVTLLRTGAIAIIAGAILAASRGGMRSWPVATLLLLWPSFGGHWVEILFLNYLRPKLPSERAVQVMARLLVWFVGGVVLLYAVRLTESVLAPQLRLTHRVPWWAGGLAFIAIEFIAHAAMALRKTPNFYNGRG